MFEESAELLGFVECGFGELAELGDEILYWNLLYRGGHGLLPKEYNAAGVSFEEHAVSVGVEAVAIGDCVFVGAEDVLASTEGAYQHEQGGLRQVEVGQHRFDHFKFEAYFMIWVDEKVGRGGAGDDCSFADANGMFERANRCGADGDYSAAGAEREIDGRGGAYRNGIRLGVEFVILDAIDPDRLESSQADVQRDIGSLDAALTNSVENLRSEMETGGGRGY